MKKLLTGAAIAGLWLAAGCSGAEDTKDGLSAKQRSDLDNAAMMLDGNQVIDTSADSLVLDENAAEPEALVANGAAATDPQNNSAGQAASENQKAPR